MPTSIWLWGEEHRRSEWHQLLAPSAPCKGKERLGERCLVQDCWFISVRVALSGTWRELFSLVIGGSHTIINLSFWYTYDYHDRVRFLETLLSHKFFSGQLPDPCTGRDDWEGAWYFILSIASTVRILPRSGWFYLEVMNRSHCSAFSLTDESRVLIKSCSGTQAGRQDYRGGHQVPYCQSLPAHDGTVYFQ